MPVSRTEHLRQLSVTAVACLVTSCCHGPYSTPITTFPENLAQKPIRIVIDKNEDYSDAEQAKLETARALAEKVLNDIEFQRAVLSYGASNSPPGYSLAKRYYPSVTITSNQQVLDALLSGNGPDGAIHLYLKKASLREGVVGSTVMSARRDGITETDADQFASMKDAELADHLIHEHMHRMGFGHHAGYSKERCNTVPYAMGRLVCEIAVKNHAASGSCAIKDNGKC